MFLRSAELIAEQRDERQMTDLAGQGMLSQAGSGGQPAPPMPQGTSPARRADGSLIMAGLMAKRMAARRGHPYSADLREQNAVLVERMASLGRNGDTELAHVTPGETVVPERVLNTGDTRHQLREGFEDAGLAPERYTVGHPASSRNPMTGQEEYFIDAIVEGAKALAGAGASIVGGAGNFVSGLLGLGSGGVSGGASALNVAMNIFGGTKDNPWGVLNSPEVVGNVIGAVGGELLRPDPVEEQLRLQRALDADRRKRMRWKFGLSEEPDRQPPGSNAARYQKGNGLNPSRSLYAATPRV